MLFGISVSVFADTQPIDTEHEEIIVGTISVGDFKKDLIKFLEFFYYALQRTV